MASSRFRDPRAWVALLTATACLAAGCAQLEYASLGNYEVPGAAATVHIVDSPETVGVFQPSLVRVHPGARVAWVNASGDYHTVTFADPGIPSSPGFAPGATFERTFTHPGAFRYSCAYHGGMVGEVDVVAGPTPPGGRAG